MIQLLLKGDTNFKGDHVSGCCMSSVEKPTVRFGNVALSSEIPFSYLLLPLMLKLELVKKSVSLYWNLTVIRNTELGIAFFTR